MPTKNQDAHDSLKISHIVNSSDDLWARSSTLFSRCLCGDVEAVHELDGLATNDDPDAVCLGFLMLVLMGKFTPSTIPRNVDRSTTIAAKLSEIFPSKISRGIELNQYEAYLLGHMYQEGWGVTKDVSKAFDYFMKSAEEGYAAGQSNVGWCYERGIGAVWDYSIAFEWYMKAALQGYVIAQYNVGGCYRNGIGVPIDSSLAVEWYMKAAEQGDAEAQYLVGRSYRYGTGVPKDETQSIKWYMMAVKQGHRAAEMEINPSSY